MNGWRYTSRNVRSSRFDDEVVRLRSCSLAMLERSGEGGSASAAAQHEEPEQADGARLTSAWPSPGHSSEVP